MKDIDRNINSQLLKNEPMFIRKDTKEFSNLSEWIIKEDVPQGLYRIQTDINANIEGNLYIGDESTEHDIFNSYFSENTKQLNCIVYIDSSFIINAYYDSAQSGTLAVSLYKF